MAYDWLYVVLKPVNEDLIRCAGLFQLLLQTVLLLSLCYCSAISVILQLQASPIVSRNIKSLFKFSCYIHRYRCATSEQSAKICLLNVHARGEFLFAHSTSFQLILNQFNWVRCLNGVMLFIIAIMFAYFILIRNFCLERGSLLGY